MSGIEHQTSSFRIPDTRLQPGEESDTKWRFQDRIDESVPHCHDTTVGMVAYSDAATFVSVEEVLIVAASGTRRSSGLRRLQVSAVRRHPNGRRGAA